MLFHDTRIRKRCSIVTDLDAAIIDTTPVPDESEATAKYKVKCQASEDAGTTRQVALDAFSAGNTWLSVHYADHTFEVDFIAAGNGAQVAEIVPFVYTKSATMTTATTELAGGVKAQYGKRVLTMAANQGKGWFAILLGKHVTHKTVLPEYIRKAIFFARGSLTVELFFNIYSYRVNCALAAGEIQSSVANTARVRLDEYRKGKIDLAALKAAMGPALPGDQIHTILVDVV